MLERIRGLWPPKWGRGWLIVMLAGVVVVPGAIMMRSTSEAAPEPATEASEVLKRVRRPVPLPASPDETAPDAESWAEKNPGDAQGLSQTAAFASPEPTESSTLEDTPSDAAARATPSIELDTPAATRLLGIEVSKTEHGSEIRLKADGTISNAKAFALADPDRLVIDLPEMSLAMKQPRVELGWDRIARVRVGTHDVKVRVVIDGGTSAQPFDDRILQPVVDGMVISLGSDVASMDPPVVMDPALQPVASLAPGAGEAAEAPRTSPGQDTPQLPHYLRGGPGANGVQALAPALEGLHDCIIEPHEVVHVGSALTGVVSSVAVERSDYVVAGQVLAELESAPEQAAVAVARARAQMDGPMLASRARLELSEQKKGRADQLFSNQAISADLRDEVRAEAKVATAVVTEARERKKLMALEHQQTFERLNEHIIRSPVSGIVVERLKSPGEVVKEETIMVVAQIDPLRVEVIVPAAAFGSVRPGVRAEVTPEIPNIGVQVATVTVVDRVVDGTSGTFGVRLELPNPDHSVPSGLRCQIRFLQGE
jgi:RND family efflux transporter MFP subunit